MKKRTKIIIGAIVLIAVALGVIIPIMNSKGMFAKGNNEEYSAANAEVFENSPLKGKTFIFLGSSVTRGAASHDESFVDYLAAQDGITAVKEAVSGTTLVDNGEKSYISRMKTIDKDIEATAFICQLSTNDATKKLPVGEISTSFNKEDFDTQTVAGAIEYIICYAQETWHCPVIFYTGTKYDSERYAELVELLDGICEKWDIGLIDLWNSSINDISKDRYSFYMADGIHPVRAGYRDWWTPAIRDYLYNNPNICDILPPM